MCTRVDVPLIFTFIYLMNAKFAEKEKALLKDPIEAAWDSNSQPFDQKVQTQTAEPHYEFNICRINK